ncbi:hypothetical protein C1H46_033933 [Malus baccata]|uniref:Pentacotripeptide-repeat region of PRORP domain-containing protein n=1 Tax=Malus baccata TaxID=106549 RepID=A0A540L202_MALBA|nr:hypothetical protein C1H46_033933 [Malus baccata]
MRREVAKLDASGSYREALYLHAQPVSACPREFTFPPLLKACGKLSPAYAIFKELDEKRNLFTGNAMIAGMILNAQAENAVELFEQLEFEGFEPDSVTWNSMISGFSQLGKGIEDFKCFKRMQSAGEVPSLKSIASLLPALDEARELIKELPEPSGAVFDSLLGACECHLDSEMGKEVATKLSELEPENLAPFVILSKMYAALGRWEDAEKIRGLMNDKTQRKLPGFSLLRLHEK